MNLEINNTSIQKRFIKAAILLLIIACFGFMFSSVLAQSLWGLNPEEMAKVLDNKDGDYVGMFRFFQSIQSVLLFIIPSVIILWAWQQPMSYKKVNREERLIQIGFACLLIVSVAPIANLIEQWSEALSFPDNLSSLESWLREKQESSQTMTQLLLNTDSFTSMLANVLALGLIPAVGEELIFRGIMQPVLTKWTKSSGWAIWVTAIVFSALHFQISGFLPRLLLGVILGYLYYWTGTLWIPILAHFLNNFIIIVLHYCLNLGLNVQPILQLGTNDEDWRFLLTGAAFAIVAIGWFLRKSEEDKTIKYY